MLGAGVCGACRLGGHGVRDALGTPAGRVWTTNSRSWCLSLGVPPKAQICVLERSCGAPFWKRGGGGWGQWEPGLLEHPLWVTQGEGHPGRGSAPSWVQPAVPGSCPGLPGVRTLLPGGRTGGVIRQPSWLRGGPPALLNRGRGLLPQEEGNAGRMSSPVADKSFPMNPC